MNYIKKYDSFVDIKFENLILESDIYYSENFKKILNGMRKNKIANILLKIDAYSTSKINKDLDVTVNFLDIKDNSDSELTFTNDRKSKDILDKKEVINMGFTYIRINDYSFNDNIVENPNGEIAINSPENIVIFKKMGYYPVLSSDVYIPKSKETGELISEYKIKYETSYNRAFYKTWYYVKFEGGETVISCVADNINIRRSKVFNYNRQDIRIGKAIRNLLNAYINKNNDFTYTDEDIENFVNEFRSIISISNRSAFDRFELVDGKSIIKFYNSKNYTQEKGNIVTSCMTNNPEYLSIYVKNPKTIKLLILKSEFDDSRILGRALVWVLNDGNMLMDNIYCSRDSDINIFEEYANKKGWYYINDYKIGEDEDLDREDPFDLTTRYIYSKAFKSYVDPYIDYEQLPSIDNMNWCNWETGELSNVKFENSVRLTFEGQGFGK